MSCCEPKDAVHGLLLADVLGLLADHDAELDLPVQLVSDAGQGEVTTRPDHTGRKLVKHHWFFGNGSSLFLAMVLVVHSNTENLNKSISIKQTVKSYYKKLDVYLSVCLIVSLSALSPSIIFCLSVTSNGQMENQD